MRAYAWRINYDATNADVMARCDEIIKQREINGANVSINPANVANVATRPAGCRHRVGPVRFECHHPPVVLRRPDAVRDEQRWLRNNSREMMTRSRRHSSHSSRRCEWEERRTMFRALRQRKSAAKDFKTRRGAIVVLAAVMIIVFLASVVFSVDVSYMQLTKAKLRAATDAAARAAGEGLSRVQDMNYARQAAKDIAAANKVAGQPLVLDDSDIVFGKSAQQGERRVDVHAERSPINAVRVFGRRTRSAPSGSVPLFFARVFNVLDFQPVQAATVVRLDRDICLVLDRSSSMKLHLTDTGGTMSTSDPRFCQPPNMSLSRWGALSVAVASVHWCVGRHSSNGIRGHWSPSPAEQRRIELHVSSCSPSFTSNTVDTNCNLASNHSAVTSAMATLSTKKWNGRTNIAAGINRGIQVLTSGIGAALCGQDDGADERRRRE